MGDVGRVIIAGWGATAYLIRQTDPTGPIHTGCHATTRLARNIPRAVAAISNGSHAGEGLGKKAGVHWNTVSAIELGKSGGRPETLAAIRKAQEKAG